MVTSNLPFRLPVYLDHHSTTPLDPRVLEAMLPYLKEDFGNASSTDHVYGARAAEAVETAREKVARSLGASPEEVVFTSGATESDNLAVSGIVSRKDLPSAHFVTSTIEHKAVLDSFRALEREGASVTYLPVDREGFVSPEALEAALTTRTKLVSVMWANNEIGTIQDVRALASVAHKGGALFHSDAAQAIGHVAISVDGADVDLLSLSAHKLHGPKGVGGLFVRRRRRRVRLSPLLMGGGQERGLRSGTPNVPGVVGLGEALSLADKDLGQEERRVARLRDQLERGLLENGEVTVNGKRSNRLPQNLNARVGDVDGKALIGATAHQLAFSASSACSSQSVEPSHVLLAIGLSPTDAHQCVRFGLGRATTKEEVDFTIDTLRLNIKKLRRIAGRGSQ